MEKDFRISTLFLALAGAIGIPAVSTFGWAASAFEEEETISCSETFGCVRGETKCAEFEITFKDGSSAHAFCFGTAPEQ